jgi:DNA-cytosine methyltransferase
VKLLDPAQGRQQPRNRIAIPAGPEPGWSRIVLIEDDSARARRRAPAGLVARRTAPEISIRVHRVKGGVATVVAEKSYSTRALGAASKPGVRTATALELLDRLRLHRKGAVVVAGPAYGSNRGFLVGLIERGFEFVVEVRPSTIVTDDSSSKTKATTAGELGSDPKWQKIKVSVPGAAAPVPYVVAKLGKVQFSPDNFGQVFAAGVGGIEGLHRGTIFGFTSVSNASLKQLTEAIGWARWIRPAVRRQERLELQDDAKAPVQRSNVGLHSNGVKLTVRSNITLARRQDQSAVETQQSTTRDNWRSQGVFESLQRLNVVELFAGAGGMGLGFLLAAQENRRYRLVCSAEVNPIYVQTMRRNHDIIRSLRKGERDVVPEKIQPLDLRLAPSFKLIEGISKQAGDVHLLIGGPPCQGFSNANRNSWHSTNPHNRLVEQFIRYVKALQPAVFLMENVQGIMWTSRNRASSTQVRVLDFLAKRFASAGYIVFPKLLDAVWFGVPQHRSRFFLLGVRTDLGYSADDFGSWGPFPLPSHGPGTQQPYVSVKASIGDLPTIGNGEARKDIPYIPPSRELLRSNAFLQLMRQGAPPNIIGDHVTSRHADYVIERYRQIPPGGNWENIVDTLTNYTDVGRTHSNIYRRLTWEEPSITIGHYRKSMLVHPSQHRGLSLREAARLQSFPDWFSFSGTPDEREGGLVHKQQQLANAVCPLVTKALAEFILGL